MSTKKRGRACEACSRNKIRCELGSSTDAEPPCARCVRLNKECVLVAPKRQKDRVAELESQVQLLTRLLHSQTIQDQSQSVANKDEKTNGLPTGFAPFALAEASSNVKKRRLDDAASAGVSSTANTPEATFDLEAWSANAPQLANTEHQAVLALDRIVPLQFQEHILQKYLMHTLPEFPLVSPGGDCSLAALRAERPTLLQAIIYAASPGILSSKVQDEITTLLLSTLSNSAITEGKKTIELIQAIQITCLWYRAPNHHKHVAVYQLIQLVAGIAEDIGIAGPQSSPSLGYPSENEAPDSTNSRRVLLVCHLLSSSMAIVMRRPKPVSWTPHHDQCVLWLENLPDGLPTDKWLGQYIRAEHLCEQISQHLGLEDILTTPKISEPTVRHKIQTCRNQILNWKALLPPALHVPTLLFWEHLATVYLHELVLYTASNKQSFAAPFVVERLSLSDFPAPTVTQEHITSLFELRSAIHNAIDLFTSFDESTLAALPGLLFASRAVYTLYVLAKMYIAVTAPGNTFGQVLPPETLQLEWRIQQVVDITASIYLIDARSSPSRILGSAAHIQEWYFNYTRRITSTSPATEQTNETQFYGVTNGMNTSFSDNDALVLGQNTTDLDGFLEFSENTDDWGLEFLFAEPLPTDEIMSLEELNKPA